MSDPNDEDARTFAHHEAAFGSVAAAHLKPDAIHDALNAYARAIHEKGGGDPAKINKIATTEHASKFFAKVARKEPDKALPPDPPPSRAELRKRGVDW
jgi:hypothetical protein